MEFFESIYVVKRAGLISTKFSHLKV